MSIERAQRWERARAIMRRDDDERVGAELYGWNTGLSIIALSYAYLFVFLLAPGLVPGPNTSVGLAQNNWHSVTNCSMDETWLHCAHLPARNDDVIATMVGVAHELLHREP